MRIDFIFMLLNLSLLTLVKTPVSGVGQQALYKVSVPPRPYLAEHTAGQAVPYVPCRYGYPWIFESHTNTPTSQNENSEIRNSELKGLSLGGRI